MRNKARAGGETEGGAVSARTEILPQSLLEAAGTSLYPKGCCSLLRAHAGTGEKREEEGVAEQSCGGTDRYRPRPLHLLRCGEVEDSCVIEGV